MKTNKKVDVIIPVYNSPEETGICIKSLYYHLSDCIESVHVHDDESDLPTQSPLQSFSYPNLYLHRSEQNRGFGPGVNYAFTFTNAPYILVLNSDTRTVGDFLSPLIEALENNQLIAAVNPAGNQFKQKRLNRCQKYAGLVKTNFLSGYAFLIRREAFEQVNGFNSIYKRGGSEDYELSRQLIDHGYWLAVHPTQQINHLGSISFNKISDKSMIMNKNRQIYFRRFPLSKTKKILISKLNIYKKLPFNL